MSRYPHIQRRVMRVEHILNWCIDWSTGRDGLIDLLADARHWCDAHGESFAELDHIAYGHYLAEINLTSPTKGVKP